MDTLRYFPWLFLNKQTKSVYFRLELNKIFMGKKSFISFLIMVVLGLMKIITFNIFVFFLILITHNSNVLISLTENMHVYIHNTHVYTYKHS